MGDWLDRLSWPARRYLADHLIGQHAYSRNVRPVITPNAWNSSSSSGKIRIHPFDQEAS